ncbi:DUF2252 domain-containing protein [Bifidobacterium sp. MA2]|uniref:DUF2252 domain-containing protein n=1 Tax=Bifidobacterium santillanense TaxID=2809028 RepID=A0ABS5UPU2_9BIFI|nr:DUF2252 domain-containing protein [Bifidobacterium santillanense]MBT1172868.1 DUF2252 domain-containing protein [Bifidobacterium santillanense]
MSEVAQDHITPSDNPPVDVTSWRQAESPRERSRAGIAARAKAPLEAHAIWQVRSGRKEAIALLEEQSAIRVPDLIPLRYKRMSASPFTFYRGTVLIMTNDLATTPVTGIPVQCVGDAHIGNFGIFRSPSARLVFDINDFDETAIGPWEWDLKRLAVSVEICGRANKLKEKDIRAAVMQCVHTYRERIKWFSEMDYLDAWYAHLDVEETLDRFETNAGGKRNRTLREAAMKALLKDNDAAAAKLCRFKDGKLRFRSDPPELVPINELDSYADLDALQARIDTLFDNYRHSLYEDRRWVFDHFHYQDAARKVVGVGSVGQRAWATVWTARDMDDPMMIQMKEATYSVLEHYCGASPYATHGERVVQGQKLIQSTADVLLGWTSFMAEDGKKRDYYVRQLWNGKGSIDIDNLNATALSDLSRMCAWCLAHAHARTGDSIAIANYLGGSDDFDKAIASFAVSYAEQNDEDYAVFKKMIKKGQLPCA